MVGGKDIPYSARVFAISYPDSEIGSFHLLEGGDL